MRLLNELYSIHSMSGCEKKMRNYIKRFVRQHCPDAVYYTDKSGNFYVTKGESDTYPCVVAHMDQVQTKHSKDFTTHQFGDVIMAFSGTKMQQEGLGADDKNGIWVALKCFLKFDVIKLAFFVREEEGCVGSSAADMDFFKDVRFVLQADRRGGSDLITDASCTELCSKEFVDIINASQFGYKETDGLCTDVMALKENGLGVCCINASCGYYNPHTDEEITKVSELYNCLDFFCNIIENCIGVYEHEYKPSYHFSYYGSHYGGKYGNFYGPEVPKFSDYSSVEQYIEDIVWYNYGWEIEELWPYVSSELETVGISYQTFIDYAYKIMYGEEYDKDWRIGNDDEEDEVDDQRIAS